MRTPQLGEAGKKSAWELPFLGLYALLLALAMPLHKMFGDEMQTWLIARDSRSLTEMFAHLRYEGHPGFYYLLLYLPAHLTWNPLPAQLINYLFSVTEAWLILSARRVQLAIRAMLIFSYFIFFNYGVMTRSYMLVLLLLTAAARCVLAERQHRKTAIILLFLAINTHAFAIPIAAMLALWMYRRKLLNSWKEFAKLFQDAEFWIALVVLLCGVGLSYYTVRIPADISLPIYGLEHHSFLYYFFLAEGQLWRTWIILPEYIFSYNTPHLLTCAFSLAVFLAAAGTLRTASSRVFFLVTTFLEVIAYAITVHTPFIHHLGILFAVFMFALIIDAYTGSEPASKAWLPRRMAAAVVFTLLGMQIFTAAYATIWYSIIPYSEGKDASDWLKQQGLDKNPLVFEPDAGGAAVLGYLERPLAYYPACHCFGSFTVYKAGRDEFREVSESELENLEHSSSLPVIVLSGSLLNGETASRLRLQLVKSFTAPRTKERQFVYERIRQ
jgi:hypothetical protein